MYDSNSIEDIDIYLINQEEDKYWASIELEEVEYSKTEWEDYYVS